MKRSSLTIAICAAVVALGAVPRLSQAATEEPFLCVLDQQQSIYAENECPAFGGPENDALEYACAYYCTPEENWHVQCYYTTEGGSGPSACPGTPINNG